MFKNTYAKRWITVLIIIFLLVFSIAILTPKNSDDYGYYLLGLSFEKHFNHYLTWSGRVIVDYFSASIMALQNNIIIAIINSLAVPLLIYNLVTLINYDKQKNTSKFWLIACLLFITYWLTNPALGESTFWIVGAANYLWPLVIISFYIKYLLKYLHQQNISNQQYILIYLFAFLSGCSNEAVSVTVGYLTFSLIIFAFANKLPQRKLTIICLILLIIGSAVLILAPGNFARASDPIFDDWKALTLSQRLQGLFSLIPHVLKSYGVIYFLLAWAMGYGWRNLAKKDKQLTVIFFSCTLIYCCVLIASPMAYKVRTYVGGIFFLYMAIPFVLYAAFNNIIKLSKLTILLFAGYLVFFLFSFGCVFKAYLALHNQEQIRLAILAKNIKQHEKNIHIPSYYALYTLKESDLPALDFAYREPFEMAKYYHVNKVITDTVIFNYTKMINNQQYCANPQQAGMAKCIYTDRNFTETTFIVEFDPKVNQYSDYQKRFAVKVFTLDSDNKETYFVTIPMRIVKIDNRYFSAVNVITNFLLENNLPKKAYIEINDMKKEIKPKNKIQYKVGLNE